MKPLTRRGKEKREHLSSQAFVAMEERATEKAMRDDVAEAFEALWSLPYDEAFDHYRSLLKDFYLVAALGDCGTTLSERHPILANSKIRNIIATLRENEGAI